MLRHQVIGTYRVSLKMDLFHFYRENLKYKIDGEKKGENEQNILKEIKIKVEQKLRTVINP